MLKISYKGVLLTVIMLVWILPLVQWFFPFVNTEKLKGAFFEEKPVALNDSSWFEHSYQEQEEKVINQHFGFRESLVRINNQLEFDLFDIINVTDIYKGKNSYLYSINFTKNSSGENFKGEPHVDSVALKIKKINEWLISRNKKLLICLAPAKEFLVRENIPTEILNKYSEINYYSSFLKKYKEYNIPVLDFIPYFKKIRDTATCQVFSGGGIHWTTYGAMLALDTLTKRIGYEINKNVNMIKFLRIETTNQPRDQDDDIHDAMNFFMDNHNDKFAYPSVEFALADTIAYKPKVLLFGDSFYWALNNTWLPPKIFSKETYFMYYFNTAIPYDPKKAGTTADQMDLMKEIENTDIIILFGSVGTMDVFPFGFDKFMLSKI